MMQLTLTETRETFSVVTTSGWLEATENEKWPQILYLQASIPFCGIKRVVLTWKD